MAEAQVRGHIHYDGAEFFKFGIFFLAWSVIFLVGAIIFASNPIGKFLGLVK